MIALQPAQYAEQTLATGVIAEAMKHEEILDRWSVLFSSGITRSRGQST
jgi:hypothetical protein